VIGARYRPWRGRGFARAAGNKLVSAGWRTPSRRALLGTIIGSAPGFLLPFAATTGFGAGRITDAYFFALSIANFVAVVYENVLQANVTPVLQSERVGGHSHFMAAVRRIIVQSTGAAAVTYVLVGGVTAALAVSARANWTASERHTCLVLMAYFAVYVVASTATAALASGLFALGDFFVPIASMALRSLVPLVGLAITHRGVSGIELFGILMCVGEALRAAFLARRLALKARSLPPGIAKPTVGVWKTGIPHAVSLVGALANPVIDRLVAAPLGPGSVTVLELGEKVFYAPLTALGSLFVIVAGVRWTEHSLRGGEALGADFRRTMRRAVILGGATAALVVGGALLISVVAGKTFAGAPTGEFVTITALLLLGLPAGLAMSLSSRLLTATRRTRILPLFALLGVTLNVGGDLLGSQLFGLEGIALASTVMRFCSALLYLAVCRNLLRTPLTAEVPTSL
jgi:peptidoglycan biosynthesis protein MviN/MurJ (putative lipid II flippase)